jgi:hypothetical protein
MFPSLSINTTPSPAMLRVIDRTNRDNVRMKMTYVKVLYILQLLLIEKSKGIARK